MTTVIVVQARTGSSRLPGKVLLPLAGAPLLVRMMERLRAVRTPAKLVVATTWEDADTPIEALCAEHGLTCYRGHPTDCLDRHLQAARSLGAQVVVKIPSDCPLIDPEVVDAVLGAFFAGDYDYVSNLHPPTWPDGLDVEVMPVEALQRAADEATKPFEREHTTPFFWENPGRFRLHNVSFEADLSRSHRWVIDYPEDYRFLTKVFDALYEPGRVFGVRDVLALLEERPDLGEINAAYKGVNWYRLHLDELRTVDFGDTRTPPDEAAASPPTPKKE